MMTDDWSPLNDQGIGLPPKHQIVESGLSCSPSPLPFPPLIITEERGMEGKNGRINHRTVAVHLKDFNSVSGIQGQRRRVEKGRNRVGGVFVIDGCV